MTDADVIDPNGHLRIQQSWNRVRDQLDTWTQQIEEYQAESAALDITLPDGIN